jgi:hypothetical protein
MNSTGNPKIYEIIYQRHIIILFKKLSKII